MAILMHPTLEQLRQLLSYDELTGQLIWLSRDASWFTDSFHSAQGRANNWNSKLAGRRAGSVHKNGYRTIDLFGHPYKEHRVIWALVRGVWPHAIDHIDGNPLNNLLENLRDVPQSENMRNRSIPSNNKSGVLGVSWDGRNAKWRASIKNGSQRVDLGRFPYLADAIKARKEAELRYGYHPNHGRAAVKQQGDM